MLRGCLTVVVVLGLVVIGITFVGVVTTRHDVRPAPIVDGGSYASGSVAGRGSDAIPPARPALKVSALTLFMDYHTNEVAADNVYRNRRLAVRGMVVEIRKDIFDKAILELATTNEFEHVSAYLAPSEQAKAASLRKYTLVTVLCEGSGMIVGSPMLKDCHLSDEDDGPKANSVDQPSAPLEPLATPDENGLYRIGRGVAPPQVLFAPEPEFSEEARQKKVNGTVTVYLVVDTNGNPQNLKVLTPLGSGLDEKAVEAVSHYKFKPAAFQGQPVPVAMNVSVNFQIF
jgi:TonB family protein